MRPLNDLSRVWDTPSWRVTLLLRVVGEEMHHPVGPPPARHAELTATVGRYDQVTADPAVEVEVDESAATWAVPCPVPVVGSGQSSDAARSPGSAAAVVCVPDRA